jgi:Fic family protein
VRDAHDGVAFWAFVPDPLPPDVLLTTDLFKAHSAADRAVAELSGIGRKLPNPHLLIEPFIYREAVLSSRIEGTQATISDLYAYKAAQLALPGMADDQSRSDVKEVANYVRALEFGLEQLGTYPLSLWFIRELHRHLLEGTRGEQQHPGEFRQVQNFIGIPQSTIRTARYIPPPAHELTALLAAFEQFIQDDDRYPALLRLALIHYQFEAIHPFLDGNGRVGRLLISLLLSHWGLLAQPLLYLSAYFERHRTDYYDLLLRVSQAGDWSAWIMFFLRGVEQQARDAFNRAAQLEHLQATWRARLTTERAAPSLVQLAEHLFAFPILSIPDAERLLGTTYRTARLNVLKLVQGGYLQPWSNQAYRRAYVAADIMRIVESRDLDGQIDT